MVASAGIIVCDLDVCWHWDGDDAIMEHGR